MTGAKVVVIEPDSIQAAKWEALLRFLEEYRQDLLVDVVANLGQRVFHDFGGRPCGCCQPLLGRKLGHRQ